MSAQLELPEAVVPSGGFGLHWYTQAPQYPKVGQPGIHHFLGEVAVGVMEQKGRTVGRVKYEVDALLYRSRKGVLVGILNYYAEERTRPAWTWSKQAT